MSAMMQNIISQLEQLSEEDRTVIRDYLRPIEWAPGVREAWVEEAKRRDPVIVDGQLPGISGEEHLARFRKLVGR